MRYVLSLLLVAVISTSGAVLFSTQANAQEGCNVNVAVSTIPDSETVFPFTVTGNVPEEFSLEADTFAQKFLLPFGEVMTVTQGDVPGWVLKNVVCTNLLRSLDENQAERFIEDDVTYFVSGSTVTLACDGFGFTTCTFINSKTEAIPTISEWAMISLVIAFGVVGFFVLRRRQAAA